MASSQADIAILRGQAWGAFWNMKAIWHSTKLPLHLRVRIFHSTCLLILLYGSESWSLTKVMTSRLDSFATSCYRYMLGVKRADRVWNEAILQAVCQKPLSTVIKQRQLLWLGHVLRVPEDDLIRQYVLYAPAHGHRPKERATLSPVLEKYPTTNGYRQHTVSVPRGAGPWRMTEFGGRSLLGRLVSECFDIPEYRLGLLSRMFLKIKFVPIPQL